MMLNYQINKYQWDEQEYVLYNVTIKHGVLNISLLNDN